MNTPIIYWKKKKKYVESRITPKGFMTLNKRDIQTYIKRLRKLHHEKGKNEPIKYYACGEYGGQTMRPHYHLIIFNVDPDLAAQAWSIDGQPLGDYFFGSVTPASCGYVLKYMCKQGKVPAHKNDDRLPEFAVMSKGLGSNYVTNDTIKWHRDLLYERMFIPWKGSRIAVPRYYYKHFYTQDERCLIGETVQLKSDLNVEKLSQKQLAKKIPDHVIAQEKDRLNQQSGRLSEKI